MKFENVYFVNGGEYYQEFGRGRCFADNCHPNDMGFWCIARTVGKVLAPLRKKKM